MHTDEGGVSRITERVIGGAFQTYCAYKILQRFSDISSMHLTLEKMNTTEFKNALRKYVKQAATMFYDAAVDTYDRDEYGSFKSTLRSAKFLQKINSKINPTESQNHRANRQFSLGATRV